MFVFHFPKSAKFSSTYWNEFHFSKMKRFDVPSFFVIQSSGMFWKEHMIGCISSQAAACFVSTGSNEVRSLFVLENAMVLWWFIYFAFRCTDREVSEQDQQHPQPWFKTNTRWILNHSAGHSTLRHFKSLSRSFNTSTSTSVAGQLQGQRVFQWSEDFCHCRMLVCFFLINLMSHARQWEHRSGFIGDFYYDVGLLVSSAYGFVVFSVCLHQKRQQGHFTMQSRCKKIRQRPDFQNKWFAVSQL